MLCPSCKIELKIADRQGIEIDYCPQCRGVWLDRGELDKIIERSTAGASPPLRQAEHIHLRADPVFERDDDDDEYRRHPGRRRKNWLSELLDFD